MPKTVTKASFSNRAGYQKGRSLGNKSSPSVKGGESLTAGSKPVGSKAPKTTEDLTAAPGYGDTLPISDLQSVADFGKAGKAAKSLKVGKSLDYAKPKGDQGSGFNYGKRR